MRSRDGAISIFATGSWR